VRARRRDLASGPPATIRTGAISCSEFAGRPRQPSFTLAIELGVGQWGSPATTRAGRRGFVRARTGVERGRAVGWCTGPNDFADQNFELPRCLGPSRFVHVISPFSLLGPGLVQVMAQARVDSGLASCQPARNCRRQARGMFGLLANF